MPRATSACRGTTSSRHAPTEVLTGGEGEQPKVLATYDDLHVTEGLHARLDIASTSLITSTTAGQFEARALSSAGRMSSGRSTRMPTQPMASATLAKFTSRLKCHISVARPRCWPL